jgi:hypothetical protein
VRAEAKETRCRAAYLLRMESRSSNSACSGRDAPLTSCAGAVLGAPLGSAASVSVRLRFAGDGDGDEGAAGSVGGVRVPLAVAMVMAGAVRDAGAMPSRRATRSGRWRRARRGLVHGLHAAHRELRHVERSRELVAA